MNIKKILEGVRNSTFPPKELKTLIEEVASRRREICNVCEYNSKNSTSSPMFPQCVLCGCFISLKVRSLSSSCGIEEYNEKHPEAPMPLKWEAIATDEQDEYIKSIIKLNDELTS